MRHSVLVLATAVVCCQGAATRAPAATAPVATCTLSVKILPRFDGAPLVFDALAHTTAAGQRVSVTRLDFILSNLELRRSDGTWVGLPGAQAFICAREGRTSFELSGVPAAGYDRARFKVGVEPEVNHRSPADYPASHPLNPTVNGLHWGWQGGYVFLAIEGNWRSAGPAIGATEGRPPGPGVEATPEGLGGYSYHIATDDNLMSIDLPITLELDRDHELGVALDVGKIFAGIHRIEMSDATASTHSRKGDRLAGQLRQNIEAAFSIAFATTRSAPAPDVVAAPRLDIAPGATPFRFTITALFPRPNLPPDNPLTEQGVELGRRLFFDPRLSINNSQSCASCHDPARAFSEARETSIGAEGRVGTRNAMPLFNLAWKNSFFWDGRAPSLRQQVLQPIQNPIEMHENLEHLAAKLASTQPGSPGAAALPGALPDALVYPRLFADAFGSTNISPDRIARALEQFLLTQTSCDAKFDRVLHGQAVFTAEEQRGFELFHTEYDPRREQYGADCFHCHGGPLFQSAAFANNGLDAEFRDAGRANATGKTGDRGKFAVPTLRNVERTAPYMHDGRFHTLEEVIEHYSTGVRRSATLDPNLAKHPDGGVRLAPDDKRALVAFLKTLTDAPP